MNASEKAGAQGLFPFVAVMLCAAVLFADAPARVGQVKSAPPDAAAREKMLASQEWQETMQAFEDWLTVQTLYDAEEVRQIRSRLQAGIDRMTAANLQSFLSDMQARLLVLMSDRALEAEDYLSQKLAVASPAFARTIRDRLPDVLTTPAAQLNQRLAALAARRTSNVKVQSKLGDARQRQVDRNKAKMAERQQARSQALSRAQAGRAAQGGGITQARDYFPDTGGGSSIGIMVGGFF